MTRPADRLFRIVRLLQIHGKRTAEQLAETLEVSVRTIYRDMDALSLSSIPIQAVTGEGYSLLPGWRLPAMQFSLEELEAVITGLRMVEAYGDAALVEDAKRVQERLLDTLPEALRDSSNDINLFVPNFYVEQEASQWLSAMRLAIREGCWIRMTYEDASGRETERTIEPLGVFFWGPQWTLAAWCTLRADYRHFRLSRIQSMLLLDPEPDAAKHSLEGFMAHVRRDKH